MASRYGIASWLTLVPIVWLRLDPDHQQRPWLDDHAQTDAHRCPGCARKYGRTHRWYSLAMPWSPIPSFCACVCSGNRSVIVPFHLTKERSLCTKQTLQSRQVVHLYHEAKGGKKQRLKRHCGVRTGVDTLNVLLAKNKRPKMGKQKGLPGVNTLLKMKPLLRSTTFAFSNYEEVLNGMS